MLRILLNNKVGSGLVDELMKKTYDPKTDEYYPAWNTINTDAEPEDLHADECLYDLKAQSAQSKIITNFIDMVDSRTLRFLESVENYDTMIVNEDDLNSKVMPYVQEELFFQEVGNLKLIQNGKNLMIERVVRKFDKDRFSAVAYLLYFIIKIEEANASNKKQDMHSFIKKLKKITKAPRIY